METLRWGDRTHHSGCGDAAKLFIWGHFRLQHLFGVLLAGQILLLGG